MKRVIVKDTNLEFTERINRIRKRSALKKMFEKPKKQPRMRCAVRTPPINCKPVKKVLPSISSIGSNDPVYDVMHLAVAHDEEESLYFDYNAYVNINRSRLVL
ncbi:hypothetical protein Tco_1059626 [Tanacetum coccineum]